MKLEEAIDILNEEKESKKHALEISGALRCDGYLEEKFRNEIQAYETILQEIEHLQKENERYKRIKPVSIDGEYEIDLEEFLNVSDKLYELERNSISKDKIREKIEEYRNKEYITEMCALKNLLKEE